METNRRMYVLLTVRGERRCREVGRKAIPEALCVIVSRLQKLNVSEIYIHNENIRNKSVTSGYRVCLSHNICNLFMLALNLAIFRH